MLKLEYQNQFKKDMKTVIKRGLDINLLRTGSHSDIGLA